MFSSVFESRWNFSSSSSAESSSRRRRSKRNQDDNLCGQLSGRTAVSFDVAPLGLFYFDTGENPPQSLPLVVRFFFELSPPQPRQRVVSRPSPILLRYSAV